MFIELDWDLKCVFFYLDRVAFPSVIAPLFLLLLMLCPSLALIITQCLLTYYHSVIWSKLRMATLLLLVTVLFCWYFSMDCWSSVLLLLTKRCCRSIASDSRTPK